MRFEKQTPSSRMRLPRLQKTAKCALASRSSAAMAASAAARPRSRSARWSRAGARSAALQSASASGGADAAGDAAAATASETASAVAIRRALIDPSRNRERRRRVNRRRKEGGAGPPGTALPSRSRTARERLAPPAGLGYAGRVRGFVETFGRPPAVTADAPGRVNVIGEHTDYNGGFVLPAAIPQRTRAALALRDDATVRAASAEVEGGRPAEYRLGEERPGRGWLDYVQGVTDRLRAGGHPVAGFDLAVTSDVPVGSGLSSSAALEVSVLRALRAALGLALDDVALALLAQRVETEFVGARVGVMDQMAASLAEGHALLFLDTRSLAWRRVPLPPSIELVVVDSGVAHSHATGEYNRRRAECEEAARRLGVALLRDVGPEELGRVANLPDVLARRARHVVTENARVLEAVGALEADDAERLGALLVRSHASLRDDYEVSSPELDLLVDLATADPDVWGARLTGGGFGGSIVAAAHAGR